MDYDTFMALPIGTERKGFDGEAYMKIDHMISDSALRGMVVCLSGENRGQLFHFSHAFQ